MADSHLIMLGASNLARGALTLTDVARAGAAGPVEVHAALGRGRSYGVRSRLLGRELEGIAQSPIWAQLDARPAQPANTTALVMDVGNDLFYGVDVARVLAWVELALERLKPHASKRLLVGIPLEVLRGMRPWMFAIFRRVIVPSYKATFAEGLELAAELHAGLEQLAQRHGAIFVPPDSSWYGFDPIHIRRAQWPAAARTLLGVDVDLDGPSPALDWWHRRISFLFAAPAESRLFGRTRRGTQPARSYADGTTVSLW